MPMWFIINKENEKKNTLDHWDNHSDSYCGWTKCSVGVKISYAQPV